MTAAAAPVLAPCPHCGHDHPETRLKCPDTDMLLPLEGRLLDRKFRLVRRLGSGGMAAVWLAKNTRVDKQVAIKLIRPEVLRSEDMVARFRSEARAAGRIDHPNICDILDYGVGPVGPYIVMEYLRGRSLAEILAEDGPLPPSMAVMIVRRAITGLEAAHKQGIIHRDLKPENVFLHKPEGGEPIVKLMDFGVAKFTDGSAEVETEHGALLGTPEYMAPEQFKGAANADARTDIWALGAILYRALTGHNAFGGPTVAATLLMVSSDDPTPIREHTSAAPAELEAVVLRCLAKDPDARYQSIEELDEALAPFENDPPEEERWPAAAMRISAAHPIVPQSQRGNEALGTTHEWPGANRGSWLDRRAIIVIVLVALLGAWGLYRIAGDGDSNTTETQGGIAAAHDEGAPVEGFSPPASSTTEGIQLEAPAQTGQTGRPGDDTGTVAPPTGGAETKVEDAASPPTSPDSSGSLAADRDDGAPEAGNHRSEAMDDTNVEPVEDPPGTIRSGKYIALTRRTPRGDHNEARRYCEGLASISHLGVHGWALANPTIARSFAGMSGVRTGRYWTSARWRGRASVISLPSGKKSSIVATRNGYRPFCVARYP